MSTSYQCGDNAALVGYVYDECGPEERAAIGAHVSVCVACAAELAALRSTRAELAAWSPPETDLGFAVVRPQASSLRPQGGFGSGASDGAGAWSLGPWAWSTRPRPVWAQLAAAAVIFAAGLSLGIASGMLEPEPAATNAAAAPGRGVTNASLVALEERLREEIAQLRPSGEPAVESAPVTGDTRGLSAADGQLLARVRALIDESERRQQRELALRTSQIVRDFDLQRRVDLEQIQRNFGQIEGLTNAEVREQRQMLNYLMRVSQPQ